MLLVKLCEHTAQSSDHSISLGRITQANLARMIGATRQSISLVLGRLQEDGAITAEATTIIVNDIAALKREAGY